MFLLETWGAWQDYQNPDNLGIAHSGCKFLVFNLQFSKQKTFSKSIVEIFFNSISNPSTFSKSIIVIFVDDLIVVMASLPPPIPLSPSLLLSLFVQHHCRY